MMRELKFYEAIREALDLCLAKDPRVYLMGLGVPDPKGIFGSTLGLQQRYGSWRVMDMPTSENGMTGIAIGSALNGMRPVLSHQRVDFSLLAMEQMVNQAAKWRYMFGGRHSVPVVIRMIIGRGWGQGPQHSQSLQAWFAHIPGLKVVMPTTPYDVKGLLISSIEDDNPVIVLEHRWLYTIVGEVPEGLYRVPLGQAKVVRGGQDLTIVATSYMVLEALRAAELLAEQGIAAEVIDVRSLRPLDGRAILESVCKTGHLIVADAAWTTCGFAAEIVALVCEHAFEHLKRPPRRVTLPDCPCPSSAALANDYYPRSVHIVAEANALLGVSGKPGLASEAVSSVPLDVPDLNFTGPF
ncbi:MAG: alpha-ketoacid dehydrogenase subunit beta [Candidatus Omnitrophica bacterium]|nr:alpha-ketoacid dehydrogenase subunit beta [Candidatus Omnitrophota bacterium]